IYCWIERLQQQRQAHEDQRLLYVAATRARKRLHWLACMSTTSGELDPPRENSLLYRLWPAVEDECRRALAEDAAPAADGALSSMSATYDQSLRRLPSGWTLPIAPPSLEWHGDAPSTIEPAIEFSWAGETTRRIGVVVHRWLQRIAEDALQGWTTERINAIAPHIERELAGTGISGDELRLARARVTQALTGALTDPRARWLLASHRDARTEQRLTLVTSAGLKRIVLDRTFVDEKGARWIVDYKTGIHEGADAEAFLNREHQRYRQQLESYAAAFEGPSQLGLYFPLVPGWREWLRGS
ncbi:MAG: PD-(D/E)XK nuclease family protein, partial [Burkholderiaceae bacterium]